MREYDGEAVCGGANVLAFAPKVHPALWGSESWEISALAADPSMVPLCELFPRFPLLFKVIDARTRLSVQVHPGEESCRVTGGSPKSEMWCALSKGSIYAGFRKGTLRADVEDAVKSGRIEDLLVRHEVDFGDVFYIPAGLVHAIGDDTRLYEVQQSSDTTFRLYDWGRTDASGKPRELHVEKALAAIDFSLEPPKAVRSLKTPYFDFTQIDVSGETVLRTGEGSFTAIFAAAGCVSAGGRGIAEGASALLPPSSECVLSAQGARVLVTRFRA